MRVGVCEEKEANGYVFIKGQSVTKGTPVPRSNTNLVDRLSRPFTQSQEGIP